MKNKYFIYIIIAGVFLNTLMFLYIKDSKLSYINMSKKMIFQEALSHFNSMIITRKWNSSHGSVYVKEHENIKENPYLTDNFIYAKDNTKLIRINPAWMTRQISELVNKNSNYFFRIISSKPLNPNNKPDIFEEKALNYLMKNKKEQYYTEFSNNKFNFLGTLNVEKSCLQCHEEQGYKINDIRGGLRVSIPIKTYNENIKQIINKTNILYLISTLTTIFLVIFSIISLRTIFKRQKTIIELNYNLENKVLIRTKELEEKSKELEKSNSELLKISTLDYLTNIPNRRYFFDVGEKSFHLASRNNTKLSIIAIDIDYFKKINDTYGHKTGDNILKHISSLIKNLMRKSDSFARIGGEEFVIMLENTHKDGVKLLAEKIRKEIWHNPYQEKNSSIVSTISLGVSHMTKDDTNIDDTLAKADIALYQAKKEGRNKTIVYN